MSTNGIALDCNYCDAITVNLKKSTCYLLEGISSRDVARRVCVTVTKGTFIFLMRFTPYAIFTVFIPVSYGIFTKLN